MLQARERAYPCPAMLQTVRKAALTLCLVLMMLWLQGYGLDAVAVAVNGLEAAAKKNAHEALEKAGYSIPSGAALTRAAAGAHETVMLHVVQQLHAYCYHLC